MNELIETIKVSSERVYNELGTGHNEKIYQKALKCELDCLGISSDMERHLNVCYVDSQCNKHCLETERIDLYVFSKTCDDIIIELKAIQRSIQEPERVQIKKYFKDLKKEDLTIGAGIIINFPQPNSKDTRTNIDFEVLHVE